MIQQISTIIAQIGRRDFFAQLLEMLRGQVAFDIAEIYIWAPRYLHGVEFYQSSAGFAAAFPGYDECFTDDPMYRAFHDNLPGGLYRPSDIATRYPQTPAYSNYYRTAQIGEELQYVVPINSDTALVIWLSRSVHSPAFDRKRVAGLVKSQAAIIASVQKHLSLVELLPSRSSATAAPACDGQRLTPREIQIVDSMLRGKSAKVTARELGIAEGTVRIHRKSIYRKLKVHSHADLFSLAGHSSVATLARYAAPQARPSTEVSP